MTKELPPVSYLRKCFSCSEDTGVLTWKARPLSHFATENACNTINSRFSGKTAGCLRPSGYLAVRMGNDLFFAHRIVWKMVHGCNPSGDIDHINKTKTDNRICNLRDVSRSQNNMNGKSAKGSTSKYLGVCWNANAGKWVAQITKDYKHKYLGLFSDEIDAAKAYDKAAIEMFGDHARPNFPDLK
jgi:hypothetical protein